MARQPSEKQIQRIHEAADALLADGIEAPTNDQVLEKMGGGSIADVSPAMREWRKKKKQAEQIMFSMPGTIKNIGLNLLSQMWSAVDSEAQKKVDQSQIEATSKTVELEDELQTCLDSIAKLEESLALASKEKLALEEMLGEANNEIKQLDKSAHRLELEKEKALTKLETAKENETLLRQQVEVLQKDLVAVAKLGGGSKSTTRSKASTSKSKS
jgi:chromosome segregation ATPase